MNQTLVLCKPDAVRRGLVGEIIGRFERKGLRIVKAELRTLDETVLSQHYAEHLDKPFYGDLVAFMSSGPVMAMVLEGDDDEAYAVVRKLMGATNPQQADPGTIRGDLAYETTENLVHGSDGHESATREIGIFFG
ncbi:MAG TPA: nucleoside-diphosphate kinase [Acidimicrobiales bacterium]|nr:nucleoside-diphosphate kinase [Acidimicrobiales bacterium]